MGTIFLTYIRKCNDIFDTHIDIETVLTFPDQGHTAGVVQKRTVACARVTHLFFFF